MRRLLRYFSWLEWLIWLGGTATAVTCFFVFHNEEYHYLIGALIGFTAVLFVSKGNPIGQLLTIVFGIFYGIISYSFRYYGEMITYLGMSAPIAVVALVTWLRHPYNGKKSEVQVNTLSAKEWGLFILSAVAVTVAFYFILEALHTANLIVSTVSVFTSYSAAYLTARRSRFYAVGYALNDVVLVVLWSMAAAEDLVNLPIVVCFSVFLLLDAYGFHYWSKLHKKQKAMPR